MAGECWLGEWPVVEEEVECLLSRRAGSVGHHREDVLGRGGGGKGERGGRGRGGRGERREVEVEDQGG